MFLTKEDLNLQSYPEILDAISREDENFIERNIKLSIAQVDKYINQIYQTDILWAQIGDDRDEFILKIVIDICLYNIYSILEETPVIRRERFNYAIEDLKDLRKGETVIEIPKKLDEDNNQVSNISYGSVNRRY